MTVGAQINPKKQNRTHQLEAQEASKSRGKSKRKNLAGLQMMQRVIMKFNLQRKPRKKIEHLMKATGQMLLMMRNNKKIQEEAVKEIRIAHQIHRF